MIYSIFVRLASPSSPSCRTLSLDWELRVPPSKAGTVDGHADVRTHDRHPAREAGDGTQEVAEQDDDSIRLDEEADKCPL